MKSLAILSYLLLYAWAAPQVKFGVDEASVTSCGLVNGQERKVGDIWESDCNNCVCRYSGIATCTLRFCGNIPVLSASSARMEVGNKEQEVLMDTGTLNTKSEANQGFDRKRSPKPGKRPEKKPWTTCWRCKNVCKGKKKGAKCRRCKKACKKPLEPGEEPSCPLQKTVGDTCYKRVEDGVDTSSYGCAANCTYKKVDCSGDDEEKFCFKPGDLPVNEHKYKNPEYKLPGFLSSYHPDSVFDLSHHDLDKMAEDLILQLNDDRVDSADTLVSLTLTTAVQMVAVKKGWHKACHMHSSDALFQVLKGKYYFKLHSSKEPIKLEPGSQMLTSKWQPHAEGNDADTITIILVNWSPVPNPKNLTTFLDKDLCENVEFPEITPPTLTKLTPQNDTLPKTWTATVLLQPFSPRQTSLNQTEQESPKNPFEQFAFQISVATMTYKYNGIWVIFVKGCNDSSESWFKVTKNKNLYSSDGKKWTPYWLNWTLPSLNWIDEKSKRYVGSSPLNWMAPKKVMDWWKVKYEGFERDTIFWYERNDVTKQAKPFRLMFSLPPPESGKGNSSHLAFFQMFSYSYIVFGEKTINENDLKQYLTESMNKIGLKCGNVEEWPVFEWPRHLEASSFSVPIDPESNPLPTRFSYHWGNETAPLSPFTRLQQTRLDWIYNRHLKNPKFYSESIMFGESETFSGNGVIVDQSLLTWKTNCSKFKTDGKPLIGQQPPWWPRLGQSQILATIQKPSTQPANWVSPLTGSNRSVSILGVLFPHSVSEHPIVQQYPDSTYLWAWYDYSELDEQRPFTKARPIAFMQSTPGKGVGTNLAIADYFDYYPINVKRPYKYTEEQLNKFCGKYNWSEQQRNVPLEDLSRAKEKVPRNQYKGKNFTEMVQVLNQWLNSSTSTKPCDEWDVKELQHIQKILYQSREPTFDHIYAKSTDNRRLRKRSLEDLTMSWDHLNSLADTHPNKNLQRIRRDGHCHEAVMWFVHHLSEDKKDSLRSANITIPLLSLNKHDANDDLDKDGRKIYDVYNEQVTCVTCHLAK